MQERPEKIEKYKIEVSNLNNIDTWFCPNIAVSNIEYDTRIRSPRKIW